MRILLVEDDDTVAEPLVDGLHRYGFAVDHVRTGRAALAFPGAQMVLLDLGLPDMDGIDVCKQLLSRSAVPVIMLTARGTEVDRVVGLELGADDYLAKPFGLRELVARIRAVARRAHPADGPAATVLPAPAAVPAARRAPPPPAAPGTAPPGTASPVAPAEISPPPAASSSARVAAPASTWAARSAPSGWPTSAGSPPPSVPVDGAAPRNGRTVRLGELTIDRRTRQVRVGQRELALAPKEFDLLALLAEDPGAVYTRQQIVETVWDPHFYGSTKTLDFHVAALRRKLGDAAWVRTVRGVGFRLAVPGPARPGPAPAGSASGPRASVAASGDGPPP